MGAFATAKTDAKAANDAVRKNHSGFDPAQNSLDYFSDRSFGDSTIHRKASCACGGGCPSCQSKSDGLKVSSPSDAAEIEADQIADTVMRMPEGRTGPVKHHEVSSDGIHRKCEQCEEDEEPVLRKAEKSSGDPVGSGASSPSSNVSSAISSGGQALDSQTRAFFEPRFGHDLSHVRIHTDDKAAGSAQDLSALAYTLNNDIVFSRGQYQPETSVGKRLLAHELAHVVQSRSVSAELRDGRGSPPDTAVEREAHGVAADYAAGRPLRSVREQAVGLHRKEKEVTKTITETISNAPAKYSKWNGSFSWKSLFGILLNATAKTLTIVMRLNSTADAKVKTKWASSIEKKWGGLFGLHVRGAKADAAEDCYQINVDVQWVDKATDAHYTITPNAPKATSGGRAGLGGTTELTGWGTADTVDITHEFGHMLGNTEEYFTTNGVDFTRGGKKQGFRDPGGGIMNNSSENPAARHYELVRINAAIDLGVAATRCKVGARCPAAKAKEK